MTTQAFQLNHEWQRLTDGKEEKLLQVFNGPVSVCDSVTAPTGDAPAHVFDPGFYTLTPPSVIWARAVKRGQMVKIVVS